MIVRKKLRAKPVSDHSQYSDIEKYISAYRENLVPKIEPAFNILYISFLSI